MHLHCLELILISVVSVFLLEFSTVTKTFSDYRGQA